MDFNDLLGAASINPAGVIVFRHRPPEPKLNSVMPWLAAERPDLFNAYQQTHGHRVEAALLGAEYVASFLGHEPSSALFVGLYRVGQTRRLTHKEYWEVPAYAEMKQWGMTGFSEESGRSHTLWFDLQLTDFYSAWSGKLVVGWPPPERSWWRRAHKNKLPVQAIHESSAFVPAMPDWQDLVVSWQQLSVLPTAWKNALSHWRGVYHIFDAASGKGYVGSACGADNILGRWSQYASSGHGGNRLLKQLDPTNFQFSVLQRLSPDLPETEVVQIESSWKKRLHTRAPFGLNDN
ncbi:GIY-YIG nuclease family protein [Devosia sp. RR2S18]|uniref:GIY-YIG nuclease family protein n=1 Tax=Devosia rhizosphaerae TaxID=3049774 RepID=UPI00254117F5|nr:GIY-YIG nuclease family protein [Devosia sp. RR2S18]WIJ25780.1 GIY-YIG nuclease family protein [Devosia sp. RR2S18]